MVECQEHGCREPRVAKGCMKEGERGVTVSPKVCMERLCGERLKRMTMQRSMKLEQHFKSTKLQSYREA